MNQFLCTPFKEAEVKTATFELGAKNAPRPNGMLGTFDHQFWPIIGKEITKVVLEVLNQGASLEGYNKSIITLIPKTKSPSPLRSYARLVFAISATKLCLGLFAT